MYHEKQEEDVSMKMSKIIIAFLFFSLLTLFACYPKIPKNSLTINVVGNGIVTGGQSGEYDRGTVFTLVAATNPGSTDVFDGWYNNDVTLETTSNYVFTLISDITITAKFKAGPVIPDETVSLVINIVGDGTVDGGNTGSYIKGSSITLTANPNDGSKFDGWYNGTTLITSNISYPLTMNQDYSITAKFSIDTGDYLSATYQHAFISGDFKQLGGTSTINGLTWSYGSMTMLGANATYGIQIGSNANPQTAGVTFTADLPSGVIVTGYTFNVCNGTGGSITAIISIGSYVEQPDDISVRNDPTNFTFEDLSVEGSSFSIYLKKNGNGAIYFHSLVINFLVPLDVVFNVSTDVIEPVDLTPGNGLIPAITYAAVTLGDYYSALGSYSTGSTLRTELQTITELKYKTSYEQSKYMLLYTDESISNPGFDYGVWDGDLIVPKWDSGSSWNREHMWACAQMKIGTGDYRPTESTRNHTSDLHNLRVACPLSNGLHGNSYMDSTTNKGTTMYPNISSSDLNGTHAFSGDHRGDVARIYFYMYMRYDGLKLNDTPWTDDVSMGKLSLLLEWHTADPVDGFEIQRNNRIYGYQGNRNPFIDYPELVSRLFQ